MRKAILVLAVAVTTGLAASAAAQTFPPDVGAGRIAWFDLSTTDLARSQDFFRQLFGWEFAPVQGTDRAVQIVAGGAGIGTLRVADGAISVFNGVVYVQVADVRASAERAAALGATIPPGFPFDLPDGTGAVGLLVEPGGHPIGLYSRVPLAPAR